MRWLPLALAALALIAAKPVSIEAPLPAQVVIVVPADYTPPYTVAQAEAVVQGWTQDVQAWFIAEVGKTFDYTFTTWQMPYRLDELGPLDACGSPGGNSVLTVVAGAAVQAGVVNLGSGNNSVGRLWFVLLGGGGWAGGTYAGGQHDLGQMLVGDWELYQEITGQQHPCSPWFFVDTGDAYGHEIMHSCNVDSHNPNIGTGDPMSAQQKRDLLHWNREFLR